MFTLVNLDSFKFGFVGLLQEHNVGRDDSARRYFPFDVQFGLVNNQIS